MIGLDVDKVFIEKAYLYTYSKDLSNFFLILTFLYFCGKGPYAGSGI